MRPDASMMDATGGVARLGRVVVLGTGTGVGKTHVACALLGELRHAGADVVGLKPVETGVGEGVSDASRLSEAAGRGAAPLHGFADPVSPHLAARRARVRVDVAAIVRWVAGQACSVTLVETAGGALSPLSDEAVQADLAAALAPARAVLVATDRLGVLHDVAATLEACRRRGVDPVVVLSAPTVPDASTGTNAGELEGLGIATVSAVFPRCGAQDDRSRGAARKVLASLRGPAQG